MAAAERTLAELEQAKQRLQRERDAMKANVDSLAEKVKEGEREVEGVLEQVAAAADKAVTAESNSGVGNSSSSGGSSSTTAVPKTTATAAPVTPTKSSSSSASSSTTTATPSKTDGVKSTHGRTITTLEFMAACNGRDPAHLALLLRETPPASLPRLIANQLEPHHIVAITQALSEFFDAKETAAYLTALSQCKRLDMVAMLLEEKDRALLASVFDKIAAGGAGDVAAIKAKFLQ